MSVALHETGHILGFTSSLDFSLQQDTLYSGRTELSNFSPLDLFRFSAESLTTENPDGSVGDLSIGGVAWFSPDGGETLTAKMSTGKDGDGFQASHWERRYDPLGIMDPTLWYQERASISELDVLAFDIMGYDLADDADDVEELFTSESLEYLLAEAKVKLANKLGISVEWLEANTDVDSSSLDLISEAEESFGDDADDDDSATESKDEFFEDLGEMMQGIYEEWSEGNQDSSSNFYEWWANNSSSKNASWQEVYEWWAQNSSSKNSSWQELYEWWAQNSSSKNSSWQEVYEWWAQNSSSKNTWWQEVFYATNENTSLDNILLPGNIDNTTVDTIYKEISGGSNDDIIAGDITNDDIFADQGDDLVDGAQGNDTIVGGVGFDTIFGSDGNDSITGGIGDDVISGESDNDVLLGNSGSDVLMGGDHDDYLDGGIGGDFLSGGNGHDVLIGRSGNDALEGEAGKDLLVGGEDQDIGNGGSGDDFIYGDQYSTQLQNSFGDNIAILNNLFQGDTDNSDINTEDTANTEDTTNVDLGKDPYRLQAEAMSWQGEKDVKQVNGSDGSVVGPNADNAWIRGTQTFNFESGLYNVVVAYHDVGKSGESKYRAGKIAVKVNGNEVNSWILDDVNFDSDLEAGNFTKKTIKEVRINQGDIFGVDSFADYTPEGYVDYIEFIPLIENTSTNESVLDENPDDSSGNSNLDSIKIEAENMELSGGYFVEKGTVIRTNSYNNWSFANSEFTGDSGYYQVVVGYIDESDGEAFLGVKIDDTQVDNWVLNQNPNGSWQYPTRTISEGMYINTNDAIEIQGMRENGEHARVDYIEFIPVEPPKVVLDSIKIEAENMELSGGYFVEKGTVIRTNSYNNWSFANSEFTGDSGYYQVVVGYIDESDGEAFLGVKIDDTQVDSWVLNQNPNGSWQYPTRTISEGMYINTNDAIEIQGMRENGEHARVDYIEFIPVEPPTDNSNSSSDDYFDLSSLIVEGSNADILKGGYGNDGIDGGEGNDVIFGEDEYNDSRNIAPINLEGGVNYGHSTYILSQAGNWDEAQAEALSFGGNLVTINDADEEANIKTIFGETEKFWIGINDVETEGNMQWISGEAVTYTNWTPGEPNNWGDGEDHAFMNNGGRWNDDDFSNPYRGIIEIEWSSVGGNDTIFGGAGNDQIYGNTGNDLIYGDYTDEFDIDRSAEGHDNITGNGGHDTLVGGAGNDILNGTDAVVAGLYEIDSLVGGAGADKFILGDANQAYYGTQGYQDYATIQDFDPSNDTIKLHGSAADYQAQQQGNDLFVSRNGDLVVILENTNNTNLNGDGFEYV